MVGQPFTFPLSEDHSEGFRKAKQTGTAFTSELAVSGNGKNHFWDRVSFIPYVDELGRPLCIVMVHRDITAEKELEVERQRTQAMQTTMKSVKHIVLNFMNAVQLYKTGLDTGQTIAPEAIEALDAVMWSTRERLADIENMPAYKEKTTSFGFPLLDAGDS